MSELDDITERRKPEKTNLGVMLDAYRFKFGLTQGELANEIGVPIKVVVGAERGSDPDGTYAAVMLLWMLKKCRR